PPGAMVAGDVLAGSFERGRYVPRVKAGRRSSQLLNPRIAMDRSAYGAVVLLRGPMRLANGPCRAQVRRSAGRQRFLQLPVGALHSDPVAGVPVWIVVAVSVALAAVAQDRDDRAAAPFIAHLLRSEHHAKEIGPGRSSHAAAERRADIPHRGQAQRVRRLGHGVHTTCDEAGFHARPSDSFYPGSLW